MESTKKSIKKNPNACVLNCGSSSSMDFVCSIHTGQALLFSLTVLWEFSFEQKKKKRSSYSPQSKTRENDVPSFHWIISFFHSMFSVWSSDITAFLSSFFQFLFLVCCSCWSPAKNEAIKNEFWIIIIEL